MDLLNSLYSIYAPTCNEGEMIRFVWSFLERDVPDAEVRTDRWGNLYVAKGEPGVAGYPTLAAHLDQVDAGRSADFRIVQEGDILYGFSPANGQREALGADDKNGIWICLKCLQEFPNLKVFLAVGEEKGCIGSNRADMAFFRDSRYVLEPDCKGGEALHTVLRGIPCAGEDFVEVLRQEAGCYEHTEGKTSDILALTLSGVGVSCVNLPAGYHQPHKADEYTVLLELQKALDTVRYLLAVLDRRYLYQYRTPVQMEMNGQSDFAPRLKNDSRHDIKNNR